MENKKPFFTATNILILITLFVLVVSMVLITLFFTMGIKTRLSPIQNASDAISTQVSKLLNPTPTVIPDPVTYIREVQSLARLETIQYSVEKVITAELNQGVFGPLFGDKLLFVAHGYVIAGVDLSQMESEDLWLEDGVLHVDLPSSEIFVATLDNDTSYVYDRETGLFRKSDPNLETSARQAAEQEIRKAAVVDGILLQAQQNAETYLERLFNTLGYAQVVFED
jgi:hypothetical protein